MNINTRSLHAPASSRWTPCLIALALCGCASTEGPAPSQPAQSVHVPAYLLADKGCAVVAGGGVGSKFADPKINRIWSEVNKQVTGYLYRDLAADAYNVREFIVPAERTPGNEQMVIGDMIRERCNRLIQVAHTVGEDANGRFFRFDISVLRLVPKPAGMTDPKTNARTVGEFSRQYRYPRTEEAFDAFHTGTFAHQVYRDLQASGVLATMR